MIIVAGERGTRMFPSLLSYTGEFNIVIDCNNAGVLAEFYSKLLGWEWTRPRANGWAAVASPTGMVFAFPEVEEYSL